MKSSYERSRPQARRVWGRGILLATLLLLAGPVGQGCGSPPPPAPPAEPPDCPEGTERCGRICRNFQTDVAHCGGCDRRCKQGATCQFGGCRSCLDACVDVQDPFDACLCRNNCPRPFLEKC
jgi:hypothetical protein